MTSPSTHFDGDLKPCLIPHAERVVVFWHRASDGRQIYSDMPVDQVIVDRAAATLAAEFNYDFEQSDDEEMYNRAYWRALALRVVAAALGRTL